MYRINNHINKPRNYGSDRLAKALQTGQFVFHTRDFANTWGITNTNTLHTTLKRYEAQRLIYRLQKGMYSLVPIADLSRDLIGIKGLHGFGYVSTETVLIRAGLMHQLLPAITLIGQKSQRFVINDQPFICRRLKDIYLFNSAGIAPVNGILTASVERAVADLLYYNPKAHIDGADRIDWTAVKALQKEVGYI